MYYRGFLLSAGQPLGQQQPHLLQMGRTTSVQELLERLFYIQREGKTKQQEPKISETENDFLDGWYPPWAFSLT